MNWKKIMGSVGVVLGIAASFYHIIDPSAIPEKYVPVYVAAGSILALFGLPPKRG